MRIKKLVRHVHGIARKYPKRFFAAILAGAVLIAILLTFAFFRLPSLETLVPGYYPEVQELGSAHFSFQQYQDYFRKLADRKGAVYAFSVLSRAPFPPGVDLHLLGHTIGDMLYKQKGIDAIKLCTDAFRNACSHSVVIGILNDYGEGVLPQIGKTCMEAPGGKGAYTMCFHGLGHGVLAYAGYDLKKAVSMCKVVGTPAYHDREYVECVGGTIMEMIAGVHDRQAWEKQVGNYFKETDPLYPCDASWMPAETRGICYTYLTPHLFTAAGGDLNHPTPEVYAKAFSYCDALPTGSDRDTCYAGFGKEFVVIAQGKDVRDIGNTPAAALQNVHDWCALADDAKGTIACNGTALSSLFWGGENTPDASLAFCALTPSGSDVAQACYGQLLSNIGYYITDPTKRIALCEKLPESYRAACKK